MNEIDIKSVKVGDRVRLLPEYYRRFHVKAPDDDEGWLIVEYVWRDNPTRFQGGLGLRVSPYGQIGSAINIGWFERTARREPPSVFHQEYLGRPTELSDAERLARELVDDFEQMCERFDARHPYLSDQHRNAREVRHMLRRLAVTMGIEREYLDEHSKRRKSPTRREVKLDPNYEFKYTKYVSQHETDSKADGSG